MNDRPAFLTGQITEKRRSARVIAVALLLFLVSVPLTSLLLGVRYTYTLRVVALGGALLGAVSGALGSFAVLRKQSLLGDALSHAALPGVAVGFLLAGRELWVLLAGAAGASFLGVGFIRLVTGYTRIKEDAAMGVVLAGWFAAGLVGLTYIQGRPDASQAGLDTFIFGQAASIVRGDILLLLAVSAVVLALLVLFWKQFKIITFDAAFAAAAGLNVRFWQALLSGLIVVAVVMGLQLAGVILMVGMLIAPGVAARQWSDQLSGMVLLSGVFGAAAGGFGAVLSAVDADLPTGPMIIVVATAIVAVSVTVAPSRGLLWELLRRRSDARRFAARTLLRDVYHYAYDHGGSNSPVPEEFLIGLRRRNGRRALRQLLAEGFLQRIETGEGRSWQLTARGVGVAREDAFNQRLWDIYRETGARLALTPVREQRERDIRAVLPAEEVEILEELVPGDGGEPLVRN
ncbi:MAG: metal ABC transporter permease [Alkalispirochaetaceae bacterium]